MFHLNSHKAIILFQDIILLSQRLISERRRLRKPLFMQPYGACERHSLAVMSIFELSQPADGCKYLIRLVIPIFLLAILSIPGSLM